MFRLNDKATLATNGFAADAEALVSLVRQRLEMYRHAHGRSMPLHSIARMISTILYGKRFFPYYVYNILGGLDEEVKERYTRSTPSAAMRGSSAVLLVQRSR